MGQAGLLGPEDTAIAIDLDAIFSLNGRYPATESPAHGIDGLSNTKYLNFGNAGSGFIVTPTALAGVPVDGFRITTANDAPGRDPAMWSLYGFHGALTTTGSGPSPAINQDGLAEAWTLIASGAVALPGDPTIDGDQRGVVGPMVAINSVTPYDHYKFIVDAIKRPSDNIMQFAEIQFFADNTDPNSVILAATDPVIAVDEVRMWNGSSFPDSEPPAAGIDQLRNELDQPSTKYLNFGEERSGLIITNSDGPVQVNYMRLWTANDAIASDPASYELYGTNDPITSVQNSNSNGTEVWTLISTGSLSLPGVLPDDLNDANGDDFRGVASDFVVINSPLSYTSYRLVFPTVKDAAAANSMQIGDIQFYTVIPEPTSTALAGIGLGMLLGSYRGRRSIH